MNEDTLKEYERLKNDCFLVTNFFEIIYNSKSYFINYILQTNKQTNT